MSVLINAISGLWELASLAAPEILFFCLAAIGMLLFGSGMLGPFMARLLGQGTGSVHLKKTMLEEEEEEEVREQRKAAADSSEEKEHCSSDTELLTALFEKNRTEAIRIWRERKFFMRAPSGMLLVDILAALRESGSPARAFVVELQQAAEKNPSLCEGDAMECLFLALDAERAAGEDQGLLKALAVALEDVGRLTSKLQCTLIDLALRREAGDGFGEAMEMMIQMSEKTQIPQHLASRVLELAALQSPNRLPGAVATLKDMRIIWAENALEAPMEEASRKNDAELCIQLHKAALNLEIPRTSKDYELLLSCLERAKAPAALRVIADDIMQDPYLEISEALGLALIRAGVGDSLDPALTARVLGRPSSPPLVAALVSA